MLRGSVDMQQVTHDGRERLATHAASASSTLLSAFVLLWNRDSFAAHRSRTQP
jgi:hypothetical protein